MANRLLAVITALIIVSAALVCATGKTETTTATTQGSVSSSGYVEHPLLARMVAEGKLPPLDQRLPEKDDIYVVQGLKSNGYQVGKYGGTANMYNHRGWLRPFNALYFAGGSNGPFRVSENGDLGVPNVFKSYEVNEDFTEWIFHLRKGLKWSDGYPLTTEEFYLFWKHDLANNQLNPSIKPEAVKIEDKAVTIYNQFGEGRTIRREIIDDYTMRYTSDKPYPFLLNNVSHMSYTKEYIIQPMHFLKAVHPDFIGMDAAEALAKKAGLKNWIDLYKFFQYSNIQSHLQTRGLFPPTINPYVCVSASDSLTIWERNPYFWKVDKEGKQLPYVDKIVCEHVRDLELIAGKDVSGESDWNIYGTSSRNISLYLENQDSGNYNVTLWRVGQMPNIMFINYMYEDPVVKKLFRTRDFRIALSQAINRDRINEAIFFGKGIPSRITILPGSANYKKEYATKYANYDPELAKRMLDAIGVKDVDGDGWREDPDGKKIQWTVTYQIATADAEPMLEMVTADWKAIGLNVDFQLMGADLFWELDPGAKLAMNVWWGDLDSVLLNRSSAFSPRDREQVPNSWTSWLKTGKGPDVPPPEVQENYNAFQRLSTSASEEERNELIDTILRNNADNVWNISSVMLPPLPVISAKDLKNVPTDQDGPLIWVWGYHMNNPYEPVQMYFDDRQQIKYEDSRLPGFYPLDAEKSPVDFALANGWVR